MQRASPNASAEPKLPEWQRLTGQEQQQLMSLMQNPAALSQLLALQQAIANPAAANPKAPANTALQAAQGLFADQPSLARQPSAPSQPAPATASGPMNPLPAFPNLASLHRPLPSPPQFDRSLLHAPLPYWTSIPRQANPANLLAAQVCAEQRSRSGLVVPPAPVADYNSSLFRSSSLGSRYLNSPLPAELSLRASSMPGAYQDIAARLQLNRAGINTATTSMIPVLSQDWLVIPFGTAQQLLPVYAGDVLAESDGDAVMLVDETGQNWPMKCKYSRADGCFQLSEGWKPFAQRWSLGHGEQLHLSRCFVSGGCVWLDVKIVRPANAAQAGSGKVDSGKRKREDAGGIEMQLASDANARLKTQAAQDDEIESEGVLEAEGESRQNSLPGASAAKGPIISVKRLISCPTYCSRLHVNQHMAEHLLPELLETRTSKPPLPYVYQSLFKHKIKIIDENNEAWTVQYEGFVSAAQRHYRFTAGWTNLVKQKGIRVGDAVVLERWTEDRFKLRMHIIKDASEEFIAAATAAKPKAAKRSTARTAQRAKPCRSPSKRVARSASTALQACSSPEAGASAQGYNATARQGYSPGRGDATALDALHAAALLCADPASLPPEAEAQAPAISKSTPSADARHNSSRAGVSAAAVAAADAAALKLDGSNLMLAAGISANQRSPAQVRLG